VDVLDPAINPPLRSNGSRAWFGWPTDVGIEKLRDEWIEASDEAQRKGIAAGIQARAFESVPYIPTGEYYVRTAFHDNLEGVNVGPALFMWSVRKRE
jgi:peptide/nickel transport system substrate-binding protein